MAVGGDQACFVIADLSGYTGYLTETELDHAQDVLADPLETTIGALGPVLRLAKLEGDAVFLYAPAGTVDGSILLDTVEQSTSLSAAACAPSGRPAPASATPAGSSPPST